MGYEQELRKEIKLLKEATLNLKKSTKGLKETTLTIKNSIKPTLCFNKNEVHLISIALHTQICIAKNPKYIKELKDVKEKINKYLDDWMYKEILFIIGMIILAIIIWILLSIGLLYCLNTLFKTGLGYSFINITASMLFIVILKGITSNETIKIKRW